MKAGAIKAVVTDLANDDLLRLGVQHEAPPEGARLIRSARLAVILKMHDC